VLNPVRCHKPPSVTIPSVSLRSSSAVNYPAFAIYVASQRVYLKTPLSVATTAASRRHAVITCYKHVVK